MFVFYASCFVIHPLFFWLMSFYKKISRFYVVLRKIIIFDALIVNRLVRINTLRRKQVCVWFLRWTSILLDSFLASFKPAKVACRHTHQHARALQTREVLSTGILGCAGRWSRGRSSSWPQSPPPCWLINAMTQAATWSVQVSKKSRACTALNVWHPASSQRVRVSHSPLGMICGRPWCRLGITLLDKPFFCGHT